MTAQNKNRVTGVVTALLIGFILWLASVGWKSKVDTSVFDLHVQAEANNHQRQMELSLELLCEMKPDNRRCR